MNFLIAFFFLLPARHLFFFSLANSKNNVQFHSSWRQYLGGYLVNLVVQKLKLCWLKNLGLPWSLWVLFTKRNYMRKDGIYLLSSILSNHYYDTVLQAFLNFRGFDFRDFLFSTVHNSILFSSPLVLVSNLHLHGFPFPRFFMCPHINNVNRGMPV